MKLHSEEKDFQCTKCGKCFVTDLSLKHHGNDVHNKNIRCEKCNKLFSKEHRLTAHIKAKLYILG